ncbi:MAG: hypothetical protein CBC28_05960 [Flavobacteriaceae bacterium TMED68]|nr:MAG: hypothetical protein CBC28_05960 [Flavobacteriaceae bacterium TMED68]
MHIIMNQNLTFTFLIMLFALNLFAQKESVFLNYNSDIPFQTPSDNDYYHLEATLMIRNIIKDIEGVLEKKMNINKQIEFTIVIQNDKGAVLPINYMVNANPYNSEASKEVFLRRSYNWFNRSFRSNIPFTN